MCIDTDNETLETLLMRYNIYLANADDGNGNDITNELMPLKTFDEWLNS